MEASPFEVAFGWSGSGVVVGGGNTQAAAVMPMFERFSGGPTFLAFGIIAPTGIGGLNDGGNTPFALEEGTLLTTSLVYRRIVPEP